MKGEKEGGRREQNASEGMLKNPRIVRCSVASHEKEREREREKSG